MENKIGAWGLSVGIEEMLDMPVLRKYIEPEWLSKITASQYKTWERSSRDILSYSEYDEDKIDELIREEIDRREKLYQLYKEKQQLLAQKRIIEAEKAGFERRYKEDMLYKGHTYDMVAIPSFRDAVMENNGRIYPKDFSLGGELTDYVPDRVDAQVMALTATTKTNRIDFGDTLNKLKDIEKVIK